MQTSTWQKKLLPFFIIMISGLAVSFMIFFFIQISHIQEALSENQQPVNNVAQTTTTLEQRKWESLYQLEQLTLSKRYYHAQLIIRTRILILSLSFLTGMTLAIIGAVFILGKFSEEGSTLEGAAEKVSVKLVSSSPGIILVFLGIVLISISIFAKTDLAITDSPLYLMDTNLSNDGNGLNKKTLSTLHKVDSAKAHSIDSILNQ